MEGCQRDVLPDVLKGFGIILVVLGHCIQAGSGKAYMESAAYFGDGWYQFIYSFHMPLFMVISGYYAWNSVHAARTSQDRRRMIIKRCVYLLMPIVAWKLIELAYLSVTGDYLYQSPGALLYDVITGILTNLWFLWAVMYSFLLVCLMHYRFKDSAWMYVLVFTAMFFTPDGLGLMAYKYMLPYYLIGFYSNKNNVLIRTAGLGQKKKGLVLFSSGVLFFVLVSFFDAGSFIYLTGYKLTGKDYGVQIQIDIYRFLVGLCGVIFWSLFWNGLLNLRWQWKTGVRILAHVGRRGMGIYIISGFLVLYVVHPLTAGWEPDYGVNLAETALVVLGSLVIVEILGRIRGIRRLVGQ